MNWLKGFLEQKTDFLVPLVPTQESNQQCASMRDKSLVPNLSQTCPKGTDPSSLLVEPGTVGQKFEALGQKSEDDLSQLEPIPPLALSPFGTSGTSLFENSQKKGWNTTLETLCIGLPLKDAQELREERAAILEYQAGLSREDAEHLAGLHRAPTNGSKNP